MASWMVHLRVADKLFEQIENLDELAFIMGNIAPDSGVPNEDWTVFQPPKDVSHFSEKSQNKNINIEKFISQYFNDHLIKKYNKKEFSFFLGYYTHLLTDIEWANNVYEPLLQAYPKEAAEDKYKLVWTAKGDWYDLDFLYLEQHPDFHAFSIYEKSVNYENVFMDIFSKDAFENRRQYITELYHSDNHGDLHRDYKYFRPEQAEDFVKRTVEKLAPIIREKALTGRETVLYRKAELKDCWELASLKGKVWKTTYRGIYSDEALDNYDIEKNAKIFEQICNNPDIELFLAQVNGETVGLMTCGKPYKPLKDFKQEVGLLYILKEYQNKGIGTGFIKLAKKLVEEKGFDRFVISVNRKNENAISFYKKMGGFVLSEDDNQKHFVIMCNNG